MCIQRCKVDSIQRFLLLESAESSLPNLSMVKSTLTTFKMCLVKGMNAVRPRFSSPLYQIYRCEWQNECVYIMFNTRIFNGFSVSCHFFIPFGVIKHAENSCTPQSTHKLKVTQPILSTQKLAHIFAYYFFVFVFVWKSNRTL